MIFTSLIFACLFVLFVANRRKRGQAQWFMGAFGFALASRYILGALLFPHWRIEWNNNRFRRREDAVISMSARSKLATGIYFAYWAIGALLCRSFSSSILVCWLIGLFGLMIVGSIAYSQDKRDCKN